MDKSLVKSFRLAPLYDYVDRLSGHKLKVETIGELELAMGRPGGEGRLA